MLAAMSPEDEEKEIMALMRAAIARSRGYADFFSWSTDRDLEEWGVVTSLAESLERNGQRFFANVKRRGRPNDPPDCEATQLDGGLVGIEVTELVDPAAIVAYKRGRPYDWANWTADRLKEALAEQISTKDRGNIKGGPYASYSLVIHTDEPLLPHQTARTFLQDCRFARPSRITRAFLLFSPDGKQATCPFLELSFKDA